MKHDKEYLIKWEKPEAYDPSVVLHKLPSPISKHMTEIYNYKVLSDGFYLVDRNVDEKIVGYAMKLFVDEALAFAQKVEITRIKK